MEIKQVNLGWHKVLLCVVLCLVFAQSEAIASDDKSNQSESLKSTIISAKAETKSGNTNGTHSSSNNWLAKEWEPVNELKSYKQNYFLAFSHSSKPNEQPTSPTIANQASIPYPIQNNEAKFQISLKHVLADYQGAGSLWLGYTQLTFWQVYDPSASKPFREIDFEPELIYSLRPNDTSILNFGVVHQSIGQAVPAERAWNRAYVEPGIQFSSNSDERLILQLRLWKILNSSDLRGNPDIGNYLGYGELNLRYIQDGGWKVNVMSRILSTQVDIAAPLSVWLLQPAQGISRDKVDAHLQYFNGYGEGLLDYNQSHVELGVGISFPF